MTIRSLKTALEKLLEGNIQTLTDPVYEPLFFIIFLYYLYLFKI